MALIAFIYLILACPTLAYAIDGNKVYIDTTKAYISAEPHTLHESGWVYFNLASKTYSGDVDLALGFDIENVQPKKAERLNGAGTWVNIADKFDSIYWTHDGFTKWYYAKNLPVVAGTTYTVRVWMNVPISTTPVSGKYGVALKASSQTLQQAKDSGNLYYLDPWFDISWLYKKPILINNTGNATDLNDFQVKLNVTYDSDMQVDFRDIRIVNDTSGASVPYWIESKVNSSYANVWFNASSIPASVWTNTTYYLYYGNAAVSAGSSGTNTFIFFDDFNDNDISDWTQGITAGQWSVSGGILTGTGSGGDACISRSLSLTDNLQLDVKARRTGTGTNWRGIGMGTPVSNYQVNVNSIVESYTNSATTRSLYVGGSVRQTNASFTLDTNWHKWSIRKYGNEHRSYFDDGSEFSYSGAFTMNANVVLYAANAVTEYDDVRVRKYASPDPTATLGTEVTVLISSWGNNYTNNQNTTIQLYENKNIKFNITTPYNDTINWWVGGVNQSNNFDNISIAFTTVDAHNVTAYVTNSSVTEYVTWNVVLNMQLLTPVNETTLYNPYPPSAPQVTFTWTSSGFPFYNLLISTDPYFNYIVASNYYSSETATVYLLSDTKYYWKVKIYLDALTPDEYSSTSWFNLISNYSVSGKTGIAGTVYQKTDAGALLPLSGAVVYIRNADLNWSSSASTGINGYYLFDNLTNNTIYSLNAKNVGYEDSQTEYVTTIPGQQIIKNIVLSKCISGFDCFYNQQYVKFKVQTLFGTKYPDVTISIYKGTDLIASDTRTTGTDGSATFLLTKDQQYRITFVSVPYGINREITIIPIDTEYILIITALDTDWNEYSTSIKDAVFMNVSKNIIDDTHADIIVSYNNLLGSTTALTVDLNQTNASDPYNQTKIDSWTTTGNGTHNFTISPYSGQQYLVHFKATHSTYGIIEKTYSIFFEKVAGIPGISTVALMWFAVICLVITAGIFSTSTAEFGSIIICGEAWMFLMLGFLAPLGNAIAIGTALTLASVIAILSYFSMKAKREGYA